MSWIWWNGLELEWKHITNHSVIKERNLISFFMKEATNNSPTLSSHQTNNWLKRRAAASNQKHFFSLSSLQEKRREEMCWFVGRAPQRKEKTSPQFFISSSSCGAQPTREEEIEEFKSCWKQKKVKGWVELSWMIAAWLQNL